MTRKRVYPDTPVALHYRQFSDIDWCALVDADEVVVVITTVLMREVDHHKDQSRGALQQRARAFSSWLGDVRRKKATVIRRNVSIELSAREPEIDVDFKAHGLEASVNDDKFVASMIRDAQTHPGVRLVCVTSDNTLSVKIDGAGFTAIDPPADKRLPDEPDPVERENRRLREEIVQLQKRIAPEAKLSLRFDNGSDRTTISLSGLDAPTSDDLDEELDAEREGLRLQFTILDRIKFRPPSTQDIDTYLTRLREWMGTFASVGVQSAHTVDLQLLLANDGPGNATNIEVELSVPQDVHLAEHRTLPNVQDRPTRPEAQEHLALLTMVRYRPSTLAHQAPFGIRNPVRVDDDGSDSHRTTIVADLGKHRSHLPLPKLQIWFDPGAVPRGLKIHYRIHTTTPPGIDEGDLHVKVTTRAGPFRVLSSRLGVIAGQDDP